MNQYPSPNVPGYWQQADVLVAPDATNTGTGITFVSAAGAYRGARLITPKPISVDTLSIYVNTAIGTATDTYNVGIYEVQPGGADARLLAAANNRNDLGAIGAKNIVLSAPAILLPGRVYYSLFHQRIVTTSGVGLNGSQWNNNGWIAQSLNLASGNSAALGYSLVTAGALADVDLPSTLALGPLPAVASPNTPNFFLYP